MNFNEDEILKREEKLVSAHHKYVTRMRLNVLCFSLFAVLGLVLVLAVCLAGALGGIFQSAPAVGEEEILYSTSTTVLYDKDGNELQTLDGSGIRQEYLELDKISSAVQNAFIAAEDADYYAHNGINVRGALALLYGDDVSVESEKSRRTLTQKLIRNQIFVNENNNSFFDQLIQKLQEQYLAWKLESEEGKEKILEYYLNTLYFGGNRIGIGSASEFYFDKSPEELNVSEATVLAAAAQDPDRYDPLAQQVDNSSMRADILGAMRSMESISEDEYEDALGDNVYIELQTAGEKKNSNSEAQNDYVSAVISQVVSDLKDRAGYSATQAYHAVYQSGMGIYTCLDGQIQALCENEVEKQLEKVSGDKKLQVSFVLMDQATGRVKALIGGAGEETPQQGTNGSIDPVREPGANLSVLSVWLPAVDTAGKTLGSVEDDCFYKYSENGVSQNTGKSVRYQGLVTLRRSILEQLKSPAIKTMEEIDVQTGYDYLKSLGISTLVDKQEDLAGNVVSDIDLSMATGNLVNGVTNLELTAAYAALANGGKRVEPLFYTKLVDRDGNILLENERTERQIIKKSTAWLLTNVLSDYAAGGEGEQAVLGDSSIATAGMSGESKGRRDLWFQGYTPYYTAGIWCGYGDGSRITTQVSCQKIWKRILKKVHAVKGTKDTDFVKPADIITCNICTKCGNLAVSGLCDEALGGSTVKQEYFVSGTQPVKSCDCHVKYKVCKKSGELATDRCPERETQERVYLKKDEESETMDSNFVLPEKLSGSRCSKHK